MSIPVVRSAADREALCLKFMPTARRIANAWGSTTDSREEATSECYLKLVGVIDATPDDKLTEAMVAECLRNFLRDTYRKTIAGSRIPTHKLLHLDAPLEGGDGLRDEFLSLHDVVADTRETNPEEEVLSRQFVHEMLAKLPIRQRKILTRYAGLDKMDPTPISRVAKQLCISRALAYEELSAAIATLRVEITKLGYAPKEDDREVVEELRNAA